MMRAPMKRDAATAFAELSDALAASGDTALPCGTDGIVTAFYHPHVAAIVAAAHGGDAGEPKMFGDSWRTTIRGTWESTTGESADLVFLLGLCTALEFSIVTVCGHPFDAHLLANVLSWLTRSGFWTARVEAVPEAQGHLLRIHCGEIVVVVMGVKPNTKTVAELPLRPSPEAA